MAYAFPSGRRMFFVREIHEPEECCLRVVITEAIAANLGTGILLGEKVEMAAVEVDPTSPSLELVWKDYATYAVQAERFFIANDATGPSSMLLELRSSAFLDHVKATTFAEDIAGALRHWQLSCMHHIVHVASANAPEISSLPPGGVYSIR